MTQTIEVPDFAEPCSTWTYPAATCDEAITGDDFDGESCSIAGQQHCECCGLAAYPTDDGHGRRVLSDRQFLGIEHVCGECARQIKSANEKRPKGCAAFYGSGPLAIPAHNPELRKYIASVDAGKIRFSWSAPRKVRSKRKGDYCPVGGTHPRLSKYINGVESGKIPAPWTKAGITYAEGLEHAKNCRCAECAQLSKGKPTAELREIFEAVQQAQHECGLRTSQRRQQVELDRAKAAEFKWNETQEQKAA